MSLDYIIGEEADAPKLAQAPFVINTHGELRIIPFPFMFLGLGDPQEQGDMMLVMMKTDVARRGCMSLLGRSVDRADEQTGDRQDNEGVVDSNGVHGFSFRKMERFSADQIPASPRFCQEFRQITPTGISTPSPHTRVSDP